MMEAIINNKEKKRISQFSSFSLPFMIPQERFRVDSTETSFIEKSKNTTVQITQYILLKAKPSQNLYRNFQLTPRLSTPKYCTPQDFLYVLAKQRS